MSRSALAVSLAAVLAMPSSAFALATCPDRTPAAVFSADPGSVKCQKTIAKVATKFYKTKLKTLGKCMLQGVPGLCPEADDVIKIEKPVLKAAEKIAADCGSDTVQGGLTSSYSSLVDDSVIGTCMLSQHNATAEVLLGILTGTPAIYSNEPGRATCAKKIQGEGIKYTIGAIKTISKCLDKQMKEGVAGNLAPICIGGWSGGSFVAPTDLKTAEKLAKAQEKAEGKVASGCEQAALFGALDTLFACGGNTTIPGLQQCVVCESWSRALDTVEQQYAESGSYVTNGPGALQTAVSAATAGDKLLIESGDYAEEVAINVGQDDLQLVGCGGATGDRPRIIPPGSPPDTNGIFASGVNGLVFQTLELFDWDENGIFVVDAIGVTFRDIIGDGNDNSTYAVFPVESDDVLVETCFATNVLDAAIYVGQSTDITVRFNTATDSPAGIEIENSANASVHNNYATGNSGGILIFKLPGLPVQLSNDHAIFNNVSDANNDVNNGSGTVGLIPDGTGMLTLSNDSSDIHHNIITNNNSFGLAVVDQEAINALTGMPVFSPTSPDQSSFDNNVFDNILLNNAQNPDTTPPNATPLAADLLFAIFEDRCVGGSNAGATCGTGSECPGGSCGVDHDNCFAGNVTTTQFSSSFITPNDCTP